MARMEDQKKAESWQTYQKQMRDAAKIEWSPAEQARREAAARPPVMMAPQATPQATPQPRLKHRQRQPSEYGAQAQG